MSPWIVEVETQVSAPRLFKGAILDWHKFGSNPDVKARRDFIDHEKFECQSSIIEGGDLGTRLESLSAHIKVVPKNGGGSIVTVTTTNKHLPGVVPDEALIAQAKGSIEKHFKAAEAYLVANPDTYV